MRMASAVRQALASPGRECDDRGVDLPNEARGALAAHDWSTAFDALTTMDKASPLAAEDLDALGQAAWWLGRIDASIDAHERAHQGFVASSQTDGAVMSAIYLSYNHVNRGDFAIGAAWHARAARLAQKIPNSPAPGYLGIVECAAAYRAGDLAGCLTRAELVTKIDEEHNDATLVAWGIHWQGLALIRQGDVDQGWRLLDEAILGVSLRHMKPLWAGFLHCNTIQVCDELADPRRAWQWIEITEPWLAKVSSGPIYPGICRMFRANVMLERGNWSAAEHEARRVCEELPTLHISTAARGHYELGEIERLRGDIEAAEVSYARARAWDSTRSRASLVCEGVDLLSSNDLELLGDPSDRAAQLTKAFNGRLMRKLAGFSR
jgi:ATP/maltotriose-dependent transcriptional regulator MalT